jgi:hypothetical protein
MWSSCLLLVTRLLRGGTYVLRSFELSQGGGSLKSHPCSYVMWANTYSDRNRIPCWNVRKNMAPPRFCIALHVEKERRYKFVASLMGECSGRRGGLPAGWYRRDVVRRGNRRTAGTRRPANLVVRSCMCSRQQCTVQPCMWATASVAPLAWKAAGSARVRDRVRRDICVMHGRRRTRQVWRTRIHAPTRPKLSQVEPSSVAHPKKRPKMETRITHARAASRAVCVSGSPYPQLLQISWECR